MQNTERFETRESATMQKIGQMGFIVAQLRNLSQGGACVEWANETFHLAKGDIVTLSITLSQLGKKYNMNAKVIWKVGRRSGMQFISSDEVMKELLGKST